jgi:hypothetical protein
MAVRMAPLVLVLAIIFVSGCIISSGKPPPPPKVYVTPCNVASTEVQVRVSGSLTTKDVTPVLHEVFVDDFTSASSTDIGKSLSVNCAWGALVGEKRDYYYCSGKYKAPELNENRVIKRFVWKEYKLGFKVEEHNVGAWVDTGGNLHQEGNMYYLTVKSVEAKCYVA